MQTAGGRVDMRREGIGAHDMLGEGIELRGAVPEEEGERDRRERMAIGVVGGVRENHLDRGRWARLAAIVAR